MTEPLVVPVWAWVAVMTAIVVMLAIDLFMHRDNHVIEFREAAVWSILWIGAGLGFGAVLWWTYGGEVAGTYYAGYLIEKALSVDNVFVFALIFTYFKVPSEAQYRVLFYGILGAIVMRLSLIVPGVLIGLPVGLVHVRVGVGAALHRGRRARLRAGRWPGPCP